MKKNQIIKKSVILMTAVLAVSAVFAITSCGEGTSDVTPTPEVSATPDAAEPTAEPTPTPTPEPTATPEPTPTPEVILEEASGSGNIVSVVKNLLNKKNVAYVYRMPDKGIYAFDATVLTHINHAFIDMAEDGTLSLQNGFIYRIRMLTKLRETNPDIKLIYSVGGWGDSYYFSDVAASPEKRTNFVNSAVKLVTKNNWDGIDIDWEYPVEGGDNITHRPEDTQNLIALCSELRTAFDALEAETGRHYFITIAAGADDSFARNLGLNQLMNYLDFINLMTYDCNNERVTSHNSPLYAGSEYGAGLVQSVENYMSYGVDPEDIVVGLAFYGSFYKGVKDEGAGTLGQNVPGAYYGDYYMKEIKAKIASGLYTRYWDDVCKVPYLVGGLSGAEFITYDDEESMQLKLDYVAGAGLGGVMYWEFGGDIDNTFNYMIANTLNINNRFNIKANMEGKNVAVGTLLEASKAKRGDMRESYAVDGSAATRWTTKKEGEQFITLDLGSSKRINSIRMRWAVDMEAEEYEIFVSDDAATWTSVGQVTNGLGGDELITIRDTAGRYVKIVFTKAASEEGDYSVNEIEVYSKD